MSKLPFMKWFTHTWRSDPQLSQCKPATRGIWADAISAMHDMDQCGQLSGTLESLARVCRCRIDEMRAAVEDIRSTGAGDVTEQNGFVTLTNRRQRREFESRQLAKDRVDKWRQKQKLRDGNADCNASEMDEKRPILYISDVRSQINIYFAEFWQAWPRKEAPDPALEAFRKLAPDRQLLDEMLGWIERACQSEQWQQTKFIPLPAKFLRQKLWKGDPPPLASNPHRDTIGAEDSCAQNPKFQCNFCEDTGRLVVLFHNENGKGKRCLGAWPWSEDREERLGIAKKADSRVFRCACQAGEPFEQLETWTPDMGE